MWQVTFAFCMLAQFCQEIKKKVIATLSLTSREKNFFWDINSECWLSPTEFWLKIQFFAMELKTEKGNCDFISQFWRLLTIATIPILTFSLNCEFLFCNSEKRYSHIKTWYKLFFARIKSELWDFFYSHDQNKLPQFYTVSHILNIFYTYSIHCAVCSKLASHSEHNQHPEIQPGCNLRNRGT